MLFGKEASGVCLGSLYLGKAWDSRDVKSHSKGYSSDDKQVLFNFYSMELKVTPYAKKILREKR